jgi:hypothetical protein
MFKRELEFYSLDTQGTDFCNIKKLKLLCLLPARKGVKWGMFRYYIQKVHAIKQNFEIYPLFTKKVMEIYKKMGSVTLINAEIDIGNNHQPTSQPIKDSPLKDLISSVKNASASRLKVEIYNEKSEGGLKVGPIKSFVKSLIDLGLFYKPKSILVKGSGSPEERDLTIDLIKDKYTLDVELGGGSRYLVFDECCIKVHKIIKDNLNEIKELIE